VPSSALPPLTAGARLFIQAAELAPTRLSVWRRKFNIIDILRIAGLERFRDPEASANPYEWNDNWRRITAQVIEWACTIPADGVREPSWGDLHELVCEARLWRPMDGALNAVFARKFSVEKTKKAYILTMTSVPELEFLDLLLERRTSPNVPAPPFPRSVNKWFAANVHTGKVKDLDEKTLDSILRYARRTINWQRSGLPEGCIGDDLQLTPHLTLGRAIDLYSILFCLRIIADSYVRVFKKSDPTLLSFTEDRICQFFVDADPSVREGEASDFLELMTYRPGLSLDASTTPLVPSGDLFVLAPALVVPAGVERTLLRSVATQPDQFGSVGRQLGDLANRLADILSREVPGISAMTRVKAQRKNGTVAGDIDVLAIDAKHNKVFAIEVKWPVEALTLREAAKVESDVKRGAIQLDGIRNALRKNEAFLPVAVQEATRGMNWSWFVATPGQLAETGIEAIVPTSIRHVLSVLPARTLVELEEKLLRRPKLGEHFLIRESQYRRLGLNVRFNFIQSLIEEADFSVF
jgi:hypothetical protein